MVQCKSQCLSRVQSFIKSVNKQIAYSYGVSKMIRLRRADFNLESMSQSYGHSNVAHAIYMQLTPLTSFRVLKYYAYAPLPRGSLRVRFAPYGNSKEKLGYALHMTKYFLSKSPRIHQILPCMDALVSCVTQLIIESQYAMLCICILNQ